ncbi:MAG: hypothetical protein ABFD54_14955 [Armatimonadota bacterium]|nr:hypothetical protein [bacterium]
MADKDAELSKYAELKQLGVYRRAYIELHEKYRFYNYQIGRRTPPPVPEETN